MKSTTTNWNTSWAKLKLHGRTDCPLSLIVNLTGKTSSVEGFNRPWQNWIRFSNHWQKWKKFRRTETSSEMRSSISKPTSIVSFRLWWSWFQPRRQPKRHYVTRSKRWKTKYAANWRRAHLFSYKGAGAVLKLDGPLKSKSRLKCKLSLQFSVIGGSRRRLGITFESVSNKWIQNWRCASSSVWRRLSSLKRSAKEVYTKKLTSNVNSSTKVKFKSEAITQERLIGRTNQKAKVLWSTMMMHSA